MSHNIGRLISVTPIGIGPDHPTNSLNYDHPQEPGEPTRFVILHFLNASFPANNRLEVDLGYSTDVFNASSGTEFWTRPINVNALPGGNIPINYIQDGANTGGVELIQFGRAHRINEGSRPCTFTNCDIFLHTDPYQEPTYDTFWICGANRDTCVSNPEWKNFETLPNDIRKSSGQAACMIVEGHGDHLSTCSATLIAEDLVLSAGHCMSILSGPSPLDPFAVLSASIVFQYQTTFDGSKPPSYAPKIFKVVEVMEYGFDEGLDYIILRIDTSAGNTGITPLSMRTDLPMVGEQIFVIHHPNGAVKKASPKNMDYETVKSVASNLISVDIDVAGGSSGSGLYDKFGNVIGVLSAGFPRDSEGSCTNFLKYFSTAKILEHIGTIPPDPSVKRDVMVVLDRSGSMSQTTSSGRQKIEEARDAASLFISMVQQGGGHRTGLASFATTPNLDHGLAPNNNANKNTLIGPPPYSGGIVGGLNPSGSTTIGGGLDTALSQFSGSATKDEVILLLTDGMQNTPPMIEDVESNIVNRRLCIVGYGDESNLDGPTLVRLAIMNDGSYTVAQDELTLKKYFASCFGDIFQSGFLMDPDFHMSRSSNETKPIKFTVCGETMVTIVLGWDRPDARLTMNLMSPAGNTIETNHPELIVDSGKTWMYVKMNLPHNSEHNGVWKVHVFRPKNGEFSQTPVELNCFMNVIAQGGPKLKRISSQKHYYTGEEYNPLVRLYYPTQVSPAHATVKLQIKKPKESTGNLLAKSGLGQTQQIVGDTISPLYDGLSKLKKANGGKIVEYEMVDVELFDDGAHGDGAMGPDGIFGNPLPNLFNASGVYTFRAIATYGETCKATRELVWSVYVDLKIDEDNTDVMMEDNGVDEEGKHNWTITITPKDQYGNLLGPGRLDSVNPSGTSGTEVTGEVIDNGNGSYTFEATTNGDHNDRPGIFINQTGTTPAVFCKPCPKSGGKRFSWWLILILIIILIFLWFWCS